MKIIHTGHTFADVEIGGLFDTTEADYKGVPGTGAWFNSSMKDLVKVSEKTYRDGKGGRHRISADSPVYNVRNSESLTIK